MKRRLFIAINLPENIRNKLIKYQEKWVNLDSIRWTRKNNLHLTLFFIGYVDDNEMYEICELIKQAVKKHEPFNITFQRIVLGPINKTPKMFWLVGPENKEFSDLQNHLNEVILKIKSRLKSKPHITLARFKRGLLDKDVNEDFRVQFSVNSIEIMQSNLKRSGAEYSILESIEL